MKIINSILVMMLLGFFSNAQDIVGDWEGMVTIPGMSLPLIFHITADDNGYTATMDSPDQGTIGIPVKTVTYEKPNLTLDLPMIGGKYDGITNNDCSEIKGAMVQKGYEMILNLKRVSTDKVVTKRPQTPKTPYDYYTEDVIFKNKVAGIELAGTLTLPKAKGKYPVVVLISGSGPQDRNEELMGHKPFLVLADYLTQHGIGVLRYDDRGVAASGGNFKTATSADFATDAYAAVQYLQTRKEVIKNKIGMIGHSEGGMIAPMVAADHPADIAFITLLAGPGTKIPELLIEQIELMSFADGIPGSKIKENLRMSQNAFDIITKENDVAKIEADLRAYFKLEFEKLPADDVAEMGGLDIAIDRQVKPLIEPWFRFFLSYDPAVKLKQVKCPVLAINGAKDLQVPADSNLPAIQKALEAGGNTQFKIEKLAGLNHLFQKCETGALSEYAKIEETMNPVALKMMTRWILEL